MKAASIDAELLRREIRYEPDTGLFFWREPKKGRRFGASVGSASKVSGYVQICIDGTVCYAHRLAVLYVTGAKPVGEIDHINGDRSDNRYQNLRDVPRQINQENRRRANANNLTGLLGVSFCKHTKRWRARIGVRHKQIKLGRFDTQEQAHEAYLQAKRALHEGNTL